MYYVDIMDIRKAFREKELKLFINKNKIYIENEAGERVYVGEFSEDNDELLL